MFIIILFLNQSLIWDKAFLISAKADFKEVDNKVTRMDEAFKIVAKLYGEPNAKPEELFNIFSAFIDNFSVHPLSPTCLIHITTRNIYFIIVYYL